MNTLELAKINASDVISGLIEENQDVTPEMNLVPAFTIKGTSFTTLIRKTFPSGAFKAQGGGVAIGETTFENKLVQCFGYENPLRETLDQCRSNRRGIDGHLAVVASGALKGAMQLIAKAFYYGRAVAYSGANAALAHPGLIDLYNTDITVDAAGTTATTGSSVWFVKFGNMEDGNVSYVYGGDTTFNLEPWQKQLAEVSTGLHAMCMVSSLLANIGVQLTNAKAVGRIKKLTEDSGKGLTDTLGYRLLEKFPADFKPDVALMTKRSRRQLQESRSSIGQVAYSGGALAPLPTDIAGVPIIVTDAISNVEALTL